MSEYLDDFTELLGAYALDAVDDDEREAIELHLVDCPRCRAEVAEHREVAAFLSQSGAPAPAGVWDRIAAELSPPAPPLRMSFSPDGEVDPLATPGGPVPSEVGDEVPPAGDVVSLAAARRTRSVRARTFLAVISAAAVLVAVLAVVAVGQSRRLHRVDSALGAASMSEIVTKAVGNSKVQVRLKGKVGTASAVVDASGQGFLITEGLPIPAKGDVYQLWGEVDGTVLSLGTFGDETKVVPFRLDPHHLGGVQAFAVTQERAPGVIASKQSPVVAGTV